MNAQSTFTAPRPVQAVAAAAVATVIGLSILLGIGTLFQSRGAPLRQLAAAERACVHNAYPSERQACMSKWIADSRTSIVAAR